MSKYKIIVLKLGANLVDLLPKFFFENVLVNSFSFTLTTFKEYLHARSLVFAIAINLCFIFPAAAVTQELKFQTTEGYKIETTFTYDESQSPKIIRERGHGKTAIINSMEVSFYQPSGRLMARYDNIIDSFVNGNYFEFNFDPTTRQIIGNLDIGGESPGEIYLKGKVKQLSLIKVADSGEEKAIDFIADE